MILKALQKLARCCLIFYCTTGQAQIIEANGDFKIEIETLVKNMPAANSEGFVKPDSASLARWRSLINALLDLHFEETDRIVRAHFPAYRLYRFLDTGWANQVYYLLRESLPPQKGWGTFAINPNYAREMAVEIPHAGFDLATEAEGAEIFRRTGARAFLLNGAARCANRAKTTCDGTWDSCGGGRYPESDMAHAVATCFQATHETMVLRRPQTYVFNLHGHASPACEDFFLSNGRADDPKPLLFDLKQSLLATNTVRVGIAGDGVSSCPLSGGTNVQGRFANNSPKPCTQAATANTGYFFHIEQSPRVRHDFSLYSLLITAINANIKPIVTRINSASTAPAAFELTATPNPLRSRTTLSFFLKAPSVVAIKIYDLVGRETMTLLNEALPAGAHQLTVAAEHLPAGTYFCRMQAEEVSQNLRLQVIK